MRRIRKMTWVLLAWTGLMIWWLVSYASSTDCSEQTGRYQKAAEQGCEAGTSIGVFMILVVAALGFLVLGMIWFMTRRKA
jgi:hypothetical protein